MNIELLKEIRKNILKFPGQFNMLTYFASTDSVGDAATGCGTAACIAGWAIYLNKKKKKEDTTLESAVIPFDFVHDKAQRLLGIKNTKLFFDDRWPKPFCDDYMRADNKRDAARIAAKAIDDFIKTNEWTE
jgi:hypothetical protein